jgi:hypothetical protein
MPEFRDDIDWDDIGSINDALNESGGGAINPDTERRNDFASFSADKYDAVKANRERYIKDDTQGWDNGWFTIGYGEDTGFSAYRDNETVWNANTGWLDDFERASSKFDDLTYLGVKSGITSFVDLLSGNTDGDLVEAREFANAMAVGSSSKEGFGAAFTNLYLSSGYTVGIMAEIATEELIALGITALTGGGGSGVLAASTVKNAALLTRLTQKLLMQSIL